MAAATEEQMNDAINTAGDFIQPIVPDLCSVCNTKLFPGDADAKGINDKVPAKLDAVICPWCQNSIVHLECALVNLSYIVCQSCGYTIYFRFDELGGLVQQLCTGEAEMVDMGTRESAFNILESMGQGLAALSLFTYNMTIDELIMLKQMAISTNKYYPNILASIDFIIQINTISCMFIGKLVSPQINVQALAAALPILHAVITPYFIEHACNEQVVALIKTVAGLRRVNDVICGEIIKKIVDISNVMGIKLLGNNNVRNLIHGLIDLNSCDMIKHIIGRYRFSHRFVDSDVYYMIERYMFENTYCDASFMPLLVFLVNGNIAVTSSKNKILQITTKLYHRNNNISQTPVYQKLLLIAERCNNSFISINDAVAEYINGRVNGDFYVNENLFCALIAPGSQGLMGAFISLIEDDQCAESAYIYRHLPNNWIYNSGLIYLDLIRKAVLFEKQAILEEMLIYIANTKQSFKTMRDLFELLLSSKYRDYAGLMLKISGYSKFLMMKQNGTIEWLFKELVEHGMYWCIPYLEIYIKNKHNYSRIIAKNSLKIMDGTMANESCFSRLFYEIIKFDIKNSFLIKYFPEYLEALLHQNTSKYTIQHILIIASFNRAFKISSSVEMITAIYELLKKQADCFFFLNAFYNMLQSQKKKNYLKKLIIIDLEENATAKSSWVIKNSQKDGILSNFKGYGEQSKCECKSYDIKKMGDCKHCALAYNIEIADLFAALRYARDNQ